MITVVLFVVTLSTIATVGTARALRVDGYRRIPTDPARLP